MVKLSTCLYRHLFKMILRIRENLCRSFLVGTLSLLCLAAAPGVRAQKAAKGETAVRKLTPIQQTALSSLAAAADELRDVEDSPARVAMSADVVKLLAQREPERCRRLLDALFDDALQARKAQGGDSAATQRRRDSDGIVRSVIKIAASFDGKLASSYTERYIETKNHEDASAATVGQVSPAAADAYLRLATELVESDPVLAVATARRALSVSAGARTLIFLETLRRRNTRLADDFLMAVAQSIAARGGDDVNELFLLYAYVFSPSYVLSVTHERLVLRQIPDYQSIVAERQVDTALAGRYLTAATQILLDPNRYAAGLARLTAGAAADLYFVKIIEPQVRAYLPAASEPLLLRQGYLEGNLDSAEVRAVQERAERWNSSQVKSDHSATNGPQSLDALLRRAEETSDPDRRDQGYYTAATAAVRDKKYDIALAAVDRMSAKSRAGARQFIGYSIAEAKIKDGALEEGEQWARRDDEMVRRAYLLTLIAYSLAQGPNKNVEHASELLREVEQLATKVEASQEGVAMRVGAAAAYARYDTSNSFLLLGAAVRSANKVEGFTGDVALNRSLQIGDFSFAYSFYDGDFAFTEVIGRQGRKNFYPTLQEVQSLKGRIPRLKAIIAICGAVLTPKQA